MRMAIRRLLHDARADLAPVHDAYDAAGRHRLGVLQEGPDDPGQGLGLEETVGVHRAKEGMTAVVDAGVQRVGLASVLLVDDPEVGVDGAAVHAAYPRGIELSHRRPGRLLELEGVDHPLQRPVGGSVVDDQDLVAGIPERQEGPGGLDAGRLFVVGWSDEGDRRHPGGGHELVGVHGVHPQPVAAEGLEGEEGHPQVRAVEQDEVQDDDEVEAVEERAGQSGQGVEHHVPLGAFIR